MRTTLGWNQRRQLASILTQKVGGSTFLNLSYSYFNNGRISEITNNLDALKTETYSYDELGRLLTAQRRSDTNIQRKYTYVYDRYGNREWQDLVAGSDSRKCASASQLPRPIGHSLSP